MRTQVVDSRRLFANDTLVKFDDWTFMYRDTYGEETDFEDADTLYLWLSERGISVDDDLEAWIDGEWE